MANLTKTDVRRHTTEIRQSAQAVRNLVDHYGVETAVTNPQVQDQIVDLLNNIDGLSASLREALADGEI